jgi:integrase
MTAVSTGVSLAKLWVQNPKRATWSPPSARDLHDERYATAREGREILEPFREWLVAEGVSAKSASNYVQSVWASLMRSGGDPIKDFENKRFTANTKHTLRAAWGRFAEWVKDDELEHFFSSKKLRRTINDKHNTRPSKALPGFDVATIDRFLETIDKDIMTPDRPWRWPVLRLMLTLGLRAGVDVTWISRETVIKAINYGSLTITSKGDKVRTLPASPVLAELTRLLELGDWWRDIADLVTQGVSAVEHKHDTAYARIAKALKEYAVQIGINVEEVQTHRFRRAAALRLYRETNDILLVQALLGHGRVTTTQRYLEDDRTAELGEAIERAYAPKG